MFWIVDIQSLRRYAVRFLPGRRRRGTFSVGLLGVLVQSAAEHREDVAAGEHADQLGRLVVRHDGQTADFVPDHVVDRLSDRGIFVDEFRQSA